MSNAQSRSLSVVALLGDIPSTGHLGDAQAQRFSLEGEDLGAQSSDFLDYASHYLGYDRKVVALYPRWRRERPERAIKFARASLQTDHIAAVPVDVPPLALSLMADQLAYLSPYLPSGLVAALVEELPNHILAGGWLGNVSNLDNIPISLKQHVGSYVPQSVFLAFSTPVKRVGRVRKHNPAPNIPFHPMKPVQMLVASSERNDRSTFDQEFLAALPSEVRTVSEQPLSAQYWGSGKFIEFAAFSAHQSALTQPLHAVRPRSCDWCNEPVVTLSCPFCKAANHAPVGQPPVYSKADEVPPPSNTNPQHDRTSGPARTALDQYSQQNTDQAQGAGTASPAAEPAARDTPSGAQQPVQRSTPAQTQDPRTQGQGQGNHAHPPAFPDEQAQHVPGNQPPHPGQAPQQPPQVRQSGPQQPAQPPSGHDPNSTVQYQRPAQPNNRAGTEQQGPPSQTQQRQSETEQRAGSAHPHHDQDPDATDQHTRSAGSPPQQ
ncbi:hypothetical protein FHX37_0824 [Haloactinospora alba]|uniref:Uncharacterized protein n=1 Tax=Haloactinospora alba TaxID=405555 RepID=A0A543NGF5_9ACTN|nr:hypothetical protein [Haloactinospora alba]TQN30936.1 hypothetical protein FHX37_0824 [Haloactinospora alba]